MKTSLIINLKNINELSKYLSIYIKFLIKIFIYSF